MLLASCDGFIYSETSVGRDVSELPVKGSALSTVTQTVAITSSWEFTVSPTKSPGRQRKLSSSPLLRKLRPSSLKVGMIPPGLFFGSSLLITWHQWFRAYGRMKRGFVEVSL